MSPRARASPGEPATAGAAPRRLRADAARNRAAVLDAARAVFAEQGLQAPLEEIASRAGVGIATLYRRFPSREQLIAAALLDKLGLYADAARQALAAADPWEAFAGYLREICGMQAADRGLSDLLSMALPASEDVERLRAQARDHVAELVRRAQAAGALRQDFTSEDLVLVLIASAAVADVTRIDAPDAWRRFVGLVLDAVRENGRHDLPAAPPAAQLAAAMIRLAAERGCGISAQSSR